MSYFDVWNKRIEDSEDQTKYTAYVKHYYELEQEAYNRILTAYPDNRSVTEGTAVELAAALGFTEKDMDIFTGFIDGIKPSTLEDLQPENITDNTPISLKIDYEKLFWNMLLTSNTLRESISLYVLLRIRKRPVHLTGSTVFWIHRCLLLQMKKKYVQLQVSCFLPSMSSRNRVTNPLILQNCLKQLQSRLLPS